MGVKSKMKSMLRRLVLLTKEKEMIPIPQPVNVEQLLKDKTALITGGNGGIGCAIAKAYVKSGAHVIVAGRNEAVLRDICKGQGTEKCKYLVMDVTDIPSISGKVQKATELFDGKIDILVNCAGIGSRSSFMDVTEQEYDAIMDTNAKGTYFLSRAVAMHMIDNHVRGHILNITSSSALRPAGTPYCMSKWAVRGLTLGLADLLIPYGITVNAIGPGPTATPMLDKYEGESIYQPYTPAGRFSMPSEVAKLAVFMVSDMGNMIVGDTVYITGGSGTVSLHR